ncbi:hypothetical protein BDV06DRAFT_141427 [Aspergillus oleicola]
MVHRSSLPTLVTVSWFSSCLHGRSKHYILGLHSAGLVSRLVYWEAIDGVGLRPRVGPIRKDQVILWTLSTIGSDQEYSVFVQQKSSQARLRYRLGTRVSLRVLMVSAKARGRVQSSEYKTCCKVLSDKFWINTASRANGLPYGRFTLLIC